MIDPGKLLKDLLATLEIERTAIRKLDGATVQEAARFKEACVATLATFDASELTPHIQDVALVRAELRRNGVLLAHARSCLREVNALCSESTALASRM